MSSATGKTAKRRIVIIGVLMLCITATTMLLTGCGESQQDKQLRECKEERLAELHSTGIVDSSYYEYNNKRPVEYYEFYRSQVINEAVNNIDKATTKDEVYAISSEAIIEIKSVYTNYLTMSAYRMCETSLPLADALYESEDLHIGAALTSHASPLSSDPYLSCWKVMLQPGVTAKIYYSNFFSPQNNMPSPINVATAENDGKEQSFSFLYKYNLYTDDPEEGNNAYVSFVFEKDGYAIAYHITHYDRKTLNIRHIKSAVYGKNFRSAVTLEKALEYIEKAKQGIDGEAADGIEYCPFGKIYCADDSAEDFSSDKFEYGSENYIEISYENAPNKLRFGLNAGNTVSLTAAEGQFMLGGKTAKEITVRGGDSIVYENNSGKTDFFKIIVKNSSGNEEGFAVFAIEPDGTAPYTSGCLVYTPLTVKSFILEPYGSNPAGEEIRSAYKKITDAACKYHESEYLKK